MPALIPELIAMAGDPTFKVTTLLHKALVAARQLKQNELVSWIEHELEGYPEGVELPPYRMLRGILCSDSKGQIPLPLSNVRREHYELMSTCPFFFPIGGLEPLANSRGLIKQPLDAGRIQAISLVYEKVLEPSLWFGPNQIQSLLEVVRTKVLRWALDLTDAGILGEEMTFTPQEQKQAQQLAPVTFNFHREVQAFQFMNGSPGSQQQQMVTCEQRVEALDDLQHWLQQVIDEGKLKREVSDELQVELDTLRAQAASPKPKWPVIGAVAGSVRAILEGAGGGVLATQALGWLTTLGAG